MGTDTSVRRQTFKAIPMFSEMSDESLDRVIGIAAEADAPAGQVLIEAGQPGAGLFVLEEGTVAVESHGNEIILGPGDFVGELALLTPAAKRSARVQAKTPVKFLAISRADFDKLLDEEPRMARSMLRILALRLANQMSS